MPSIDKYAAYFDIEEVDCQERAAFRMRAASKIEGRPGFIHGGSLAGLLEVAAVRHVQKVTDLGKDVRPLSMTIDFQRGARMVDSFCAAETLFLTRRIIIVDAFLWQEHVDKHVATARCHFLLNRKVAV